MKKKKKKGKEKEKIFARGQRIRFNRERRDFLLRIYPRFESNDRWIYDIISLFRNIQKLARDRYTHDAYTHYIEIYAHTYMHTQRN